MRLCKKLKENHNVTILTGKGSVFLPPLLTKNSKRQCNYASKDLLFIKISSFKLGVAKKGEFNIVINNFVLKTKNH